MVPMLGDICDRHLAALTWLAMTGHKNFSALRAALTPTQKAAVSAKVPREIDLVRDRSRRLIKTLDDGT